MENTVSHALAVLEEPVQYICLAWMATLYALKIRALVEETDAAGKSRAQGRSLRGSGTLSVKRAAPLGHGEHEQEPVFLRGIHDFPHCGGPDHWLNVFHSLDTPS